jgi:hypothetical protein
MLPLFLLLGNEAISIGNRFKQHQPASPEL